MRLTTGNGCFRSHIEHRFQLRLLKDSSSERCWPHTEQCVLLSQPQDSPGLCVGVVKRRALQPPSHSISFPASPLLTAHAFRLSMTRPPTSYRRHGTITRVLSGAMPSFCEFQDGDTRASTPWSLSAANGEKAGGRIVSAHCPGH